ncbi:heparinase II/III family protein [Paenibacillus sp. YN15]|uniref:heparinase II/III family protein n=1 Tax=Paenibacillus sp. YN15 TaxID=1742774 RepID=UPI000DCAFEA0|nr:heparinase II/III family protein [Paenibacillus sp. YN15]RAV01969.1 hypothetical protein DQG13_10600 [Paenibacillus sp. YN15]
MIPFPMIREAVLEPGAGREAEGFPFGSGWRETLRQAAGHPAYAHLTDEIREEAARAKGEPLLPLLLSDFRLFETKGTRGEYELPYFDRRRRALALLLATLLDETDEHLTALEDLLWEICNEFTWCVPAHHSVELTVGLKRTHPPEQIVDLFAAITGHQLAETLFLLKGRLDSRVAERVTAEIFRRILDPLGPGRAQFGWERATNNWAAVCAGSAGMTALLLMDDREHLAELLGRLLDALSSYLAGFEEDGGCPEGLSYWIFGFGYYTYFADMLERYTLGRIRLMDGAKLRRIAEFPMAVMLSDGHFVNYSDSSGRTQLHTGLVSRLIERYGLSVPYMKGITSFHQDPCYRYAYVSRNLLWSSPALMGRPASEGEWELEQLQWVVSRHRRKGAMVAFSAKGGHNGEPHNHNDVGHFIIHAEGESLLSDLGSGAYCKEYFGGKRYTFPEPSGRGHSVPVIEGMEQQAGRECGALVLEKDISPGRVRLALDATAAYPVASLQRYIRRFDWSMEDGERAAVLNLQDRFAFVEKPGQVEEAFISVFKPGVDSSGGRIYWTGATGTVTLVYDSQVWQPQVEELPLGKSPGMAYRVALRLLQPAKEILFSGVFRIDIS